jgi:hypothetical protein
MTLHALSAPRFVRRTQLGPGEYRRNFRQIDADIIAAVTSREADEVTPLMSKVYLRLVSAPVEFWEREGVLYFTAKEADGRLVKSSKVLYEQLGVASATAHKALRWMHEQGIIGYSAGKNGVGIRIFLNRAVSSIGVRDNLSGKKILPFACGSNGAAHGSTLEPAFKDSFAVSEVSDSDENPRAPENGADTKQAGKKVLAPHDYRPCAPKQGEGREVENISKHPGVASMDEIVERLKRELEPCMKAAATQAAAQTAMREVARTREWFEAKALPKAVRVAQHETYNLLRKHGAFDERMRRARAELEVGRSAGESDTPPVAHRLSPEEIREMAESCVALLEMQGKSVDVTLSEISSAGGGWLLPQDAPRVREAALDLLGERNERS